MALISEIAKEGAAKETEEEALPEKSEVPLASAVEAAKGAPAGESSDALVVEEVKEEEAVSPAKSKPPPSALVAGSVMEAAKGTPAGESSDALVVEEELKEEEEEDASPGKSEPPPPALAAGSVREAAKEASIGERPNAQVAESSDPPVAVGAGAGQELSDESAPDSSPQAGVAAGAPAGEAAPPPAGGRCKAMMEVVRKEQGKWTVSKLILEHNHPLEPPPGGGGEALVVPAMGMEFKSAEAAKALYYVFGELSGFKPRTGSNRRSERSGALIMQRFLCWRGNYLLYRKNSEAGAGTRKRGPYKKRARLEEEGSAVAAAKRHVDAVEVQEAAAGEHGAWQFAPYPVFVGFAAVPIATMGAATGEAEARAISVPPPPLHFIFPPPHPTPVFPAALPLPFQQKRSVSSEEKKKQRREKKKKREKERGEKEGEGEREKRRREKERRKLRKYSNGQPHHHPQTPLP